MLHAPRSCRAEEPRRRWWARRARTLTACACTYDVPLPDGWGTCLDLRVAALLASALDSVERGSGPHEAMKRLLHLDARRSYGEGLVRLHPGTPLAYLAEDLCEEALEAAERARRRLHAQVEKKEQKNGGETRLLAELTQKRNSVRTDRYLGMTTPEGALILELRTLAQRPGSLLLEASRTELETLAVETGRVTSNGRPVYTLTDLGKSLPAESLEVLQVLYPEGDGAAEGLVEAALALTRST